MSERPARQSATELPDSLTLALVKAKCRVYY
jgi:hypothetical protein